ncbi:MAG TPA: hypothetical protein VHV29_12000 [Terriglobales bacterium]|jgi:hypothetical protein|nr:hypothetical protein [Terriglobales bacterium]
MRILSLMFSAVLLSCVAFAQTPVPGRVGVYGCSGPYIPMLTTPEVSLQTVSANPVGASNATYGLSAGATNGTLSNVTGNLGGTYTQPVWYSGGTTPLISSPAVELSVPVLGHMHNMERMEDMGRERAEHQNRAWVYYASAEESASPVEASTAARSGRHAARTITNQDVDQENSKNGMVKYDGKSEQIK